jgi:VWFA-related protein
MELRLQRRGSGFCRTKEVAMTPRHALRFACGFLLVVSSMSAQEYGETVEVDVVTVDVEVHDRQGRPVTNLERDDFQVFEDGRRVDVSNFERVVGGAETAAAAGATPAGSATSAGEGAYVVVYLDNLHLRPGSRARAVRQVRDFLARGLAGQRVMIASQDRGAFDVRLPFSADPAAVAAALDEVSTLPAYGQEREMARLTAVQAIATLQHQNVEQGTPCFQDIVEPVKGYAELTRQEVRGTLGQLAVLVNSLAGLPGRKALLYVSDGIPLQPGQELFEVLRQICGGGNATSGLGWTSQPEVPGTFLRPTESEVDVPTFVASDVGSGAYPAQSASLDAAGYDLTTELRRLGAHAAAPRVTLYTLQAEAADVARASSARNGDEGLLHVPAVAALAASNVRDPLVYLAYQTGGRAILDANDLGGELARMREGLATYYSLGYVPKHRGDAKEHRIEVRIKRSGLRLTYRRNYRDKPQLEQAADRLLATLIHGYEDNPLAVTVKVAPPQLLASGRQRVTARLLVPLSKVATLTRDDVYEAKLRVLVIVADLAGGRSELRQLEVPVRVPRPEVTTTPDGKYAYDVRLELGAGEHVVAFAVRDELGGMASFLRRNVGAVEPSPVLAAAGTQAIGASRPATTSASAASAMSANGTPERSAIASRSLPPSD